MAQSTNDGKTLADVPADTLAQYNEFLDHSYVVSLAMARIPTMSGSASSRRLQHCFKGHRGAVTALADKLVGRFGDTKLLASGGEIVLSGCCRLVPVLRIRQ